MSRPLIGVTTSRRGGWRSYLMHRLALSRAGARAMRLVAGEALPTDELDGLVIGGGDDIGAELYGGQVLPDVRIDPERDKLELRLLEGALPRGLPILGICRGSQMLNIALGGTLHTDIHAVYVAGAADAHRAAAEDHPRRRGQPARPHPALQPVPGERAPPPVGRPRRARPEGRRAGRVRIVQATEGAGPSFLLGVQWHPELLVFTRPQQRIFAALAEAARAAKEHAQAPVASAA